MALVAALPFASQSARANDHRVMLASQSDWNARVGFYLSLENSAPDAVLRPETMRLVLGVADGASWRFLATSPNWQMEHEYSVKAVIGPKAAALWLDGDRVQESFGVFRPLAGDVVADQIPSWASGPAATMVEQTSLSLSSSDGRRARAAFAAPDKGPLAVKLFEPQTPVRLPWSTSASGTSTIEATFRLRAAPSLASLAPFIDRFGQSIHASWPDKVRSDEVIRRSIAEEERRSSGWTRPGTLDAYGGAKDAVWRETPTGFYRTVRRNGLWWLISPEGNPVFYTGLCTVDVAPFERTPVSGREFLFAELPPRTGDTAAAWGRDIWGANDGADYVSFYAANLARKYGTDWQYKAARQIRSRLSRWGYTGNGKWCSVEFTGIPALPVLFHGDVPNVARHPDIFDPAIRALFRESLRRQIEPRSGDAMVVGWSVGNEYPEIVTRAEIVDVLAKSASVPAKRALVDFGVDTLHGGDAAAAGTAWSVPAATRAALYAASPTPPDTDLEAMRRFYADRYYRYLFETVKEIDPNHLYLGSWIVPGWWENEEDWRLIAKHCDVVGYDRYAETFTDGPLDALMRESGKPVLCGEFSFPPTYDGERGFGVYGVWSRNDADAGRRYGQWLRDATRNPYCVGTAYFQYRDQPLTGRGPGRGDRLVIDEHYAFGLVDITDRPKWDLIQRVRAANLRATSDRLTASDAAGVSQPGLAAAHP